MTITITLIITILVLFLLGRHLGIQFTYQSFIKSLSLERVLTTLLGLILFVFLMIPYSSFPTYTSIAYPLVYSLVRWSLISLYTYFVLYKTLSISLSFLSCIWFNINFLIFYTYLVAFNTLVYGLKEPFYMEDFSVFAQYRYLSFLIIGVILLCLYLLYMLAPVISSHLKALFLLMSYPYLYEETVKVLSAWEQTFWGPLFDHIIIKINTSKAYRYTFFIMHTILYFIIPLIFTLLLFYIVFLHCDFRYLVYMMPLSFIAWLYRHLAYYFFAFLDINSRALRELLNIIVLGKNISIDPSIASYNPKDICFTLSDKAYKEYDSNHDYVLLLKSFAETFCNLGQCTVYVQQYQHNLFFLPYFIVAIRYICWFKLSLFFFSQDLLAVNIFSKIAPKLTFTRSYVTKAYYPLKQYQKKLETVTNGDYKAGHPVTTDVALADTQGDVPFMHQPTHEGGPATNPSKILSTQVDINGNPVPQSAVYPLKGTNFPGTWLDKELPNSEAFYKRPEVIANDKANSE
jgi:hypothetical protein